MNKKLAVLIIACIVLNLSGSLFASAEFYDIEKNVFFDMNAMNTVLTHTDLFLSGYLLTAMKISVEIIKCKDPKPGPINRKAKKEPLGVINSFCCTLKYDSKVQNIKKCKSLDIFRCAELKAGPFFIFSCDISNKCLGVSILLLLLLCLLPRGSIEASANLLKLNMQF